MDTCTIGGKDWTRPELEALTVAELRGRLRPAQESLGLTPYELAGALGKSALLDKVFGNGSNGQKPQEKEEKREDTGIEKLRALDILLSGAKAGLDREAVLDLIREHVATLTLPRILEIHHKGEEPVRLDCAHAEFERAFRKVQGGIHLFMVGPSGSGKTELCSQIAKALKLPYRAVSVCRQTSKMDLLGYMDVNGKYVPSAFYEMYSGNCQDGAGLILLDEIDNGNENTMNLLNAGTSNGSMMFPCGMVQKHEGFRLCCAANTYGKGADRMYAGRVQLDAAFLARFYFFPLDYDETLEAKISANNPEVATLMQKYRANIRKLNIRAIAGTRQIVLALKALATGDTMAEAMDGVLFSTLDADTAKKVKGE